MKPYLAIIIIIILVLLSCEKTYNRTDINSFKGLTKKFIKNHQYEKLMQLTNDFDAEDKLAMLVMDANMQDLKQLLKSSDLTFIDYNDQSDMSKLHQTYGVNNLNLFVRGNESVYNIKASIFKNSDGQYYYEDFRCENLTQDCLTHKTSIYLPTTFEFTESFWRPDASGNTFLKFNVKGKNRTNYPVEELKFRLILNTLHGKELFNKTITKHDRIEAGDTFQFEINELQNFYTGHHLNKETLEFKTELLQVLPKPANSSCEILSLLNVDY